MPYKNSQIVVGKYGRSKKRKGFRIKFRFGRKLFYLAVLLAILLGIFYFLFISDKFGIKAVNISGLKTISEEEVARAANDVLGDRKFGFLKSKNYFLISPDKLRASILALFPKIAALEIEKTTKKLDIAVEEREIAGVWCRDGCFYIDKTGVIFEEAPKSFGSLMISIEDRRDVAANLGSAVLTGEQIAFVTAAHGLISRNFPFSLRTFIVTLAGEYEILTSENWRILLNKNESAEYQLSNLKHLLDEKIQTRRGELVYIDLRLGNKVYYKFRADID